jgi:hypothetical protein
VGGLFQSDQFFRIVSVTAIPGRLSEVGNLSAFTTFLPSYEGKSGPNVVSNVQIVVAEPDITKSNLSYR